MPTAYSRWVHLEAADGRHESAAAAPPSRRLNLTNTIVIKFLEV